MHTSDKQFIDDSDFSTEDEIDSDYVPPYKRQNLDLRENQ